MRRPALALLLALAPLGCTQKLPVVVPAGPVPRLAVVPDSVQAIFTAHCAKCHGGPSPLAGQSLETARDSWLALVNVRSEEDTTFFRVVPFDTLDSWLVMKLKGDARIVGSQMPLGDPPLPSATIDVVTGWVAQGAPADSIPLAAMTANWTR